MDSQNNKPIPLKFHNFYSKAYLPFILFTSSLNFLSYFYSVTLWKSYDSTEKVLFVFFFIFDICFIYLLWLVVNELPKLTPDGFHLNKLYLGAFSLRSIVYSLFSNNIAQEFAAACGISLIAFIINDYYKKRMHLFVDDKPVTDIASESNSASEADILDTMLQEKSEKVKIVIKRKPTK